jgi:hypothetical protein
VIDHCTWTDPLEKIVLGSLDNYQDRVAASEDPAGVYDEIELSSMFDSFNSDTLHSPAGLSTHSSSTATLSSTNGKDGVNAANSKRRSLFSRKS